MKGIGEACRALTFPVVSGNVSLYNETHGQGILPTPAIGGVGLLPDVTQMATLAFKQEGDAIILIGGHGTHLGQSMYLREVLGREEGTPPPVDLALEKKNGDFVRIMIRKRPHNRCARHLRRRVDGGPGRHVTGLRHRLQDRAARGQ